MLDVGVYQTILIILAKQILGQRYKSEETIKLAGIFASRRGHSWLCLFGQWCLLLLESRGACCTSSTGCNFPCPLSLSLCFTNFY